MGGDASKNDREARTHQMTQICIVPQVSGVGGMVSFRGKFTTGLQARGIEVTHNAQLPTIDSLLVIGGTRDLVAYGVQNDGVSVLSNASMG